MNKSIRQKVYDKYNGLCAYTGKPLQSDWQVDHITPKCHWIWKQKEETRLGLGYGYTLNDIENLVAAERIVNHYKRSLCLEGFRKYMMDFHKRLAKLPKKTSVSRTEARIRYMNKVADMFGVTPDKPFSGKFYFEEVSICER